MFHQAPLMRKANKTAESLRSPIRVQATASVVKAETVGVDDDQ